MSKDEAKTHVDQIMESIDYNKSGTIDYSEFVVACISKDKMLKKRKLEKVHWGRVDLRLKTAKPVNNDPRQTNKHTDRQWS